MRRNSLDFHFKLFSAHDDTTMREITLFELLRSTLDSDNILHAQNVHFTFQKKTPVTHSHETRKRNAFTLSLPLFRQATSESTEESTLSNSSPTETDGTSIF